MSQWLSVDTQENGFMTAAHRQKRKETKPRSYESNFCVSDDLAVQFLVLFSIHFIGNKTANAAPFSCSQINEWKYKELCACTCQSSLFSRRLGQQRRSDQDIERWFAFHAGQSPKRKEQRRDPSIFYCSHSKSLITFIFYEMCEQENVMDQVFERLRFPFPVPIQP